MKNYDVAVCGGGLTDDFSALDVAELQKKLQANGVVLHETDMV